MSDLIKINEVIADLENELENIKEFSTVLKKIEGLNLSINTAANNVVKSVDLINSSRDELIKITNSYNEVFSNIRSNIEKMLNDIQQSNNNFYINTSSKFDELFKNNDLLRNDVGKMIENNLTKLQTSNNEFNKKFIKNIDDLHIENKSFQRNLDSTINTTLDKLKIAIQADIRNELTHNLNQLKSHSEQTLSAMSNKLAEDNKKQTNIMYVILVFVLIVCGASIF